MKNKRVAEGLNAVETSHSVWLWVKNEENQVDLCHKLMRLEIRTLWQNSDMSEVGF